MAKKHRSLLGNCEAQPNELDGFSQGDVWRWVGVHVFVHVRVCVCSCVCMCVCVFVCGCFDILTLNVLHFLKGR